MISDELELVFYFDSSVLCNLSNVADCFLKAGQYESEQLGENPQCHKLTLHSLTTVKTVILVPGCIQTQLNSVNKQLPFLCFYGYYKYSSAG